MNKQQIISAKIAKLIAEGKSREQAIAIAYSMYESENKAQEGVKLQKPIISDIDYTDMGGLSYNKPMQNYADSLKGVMLTPYGESLREQSVYATTPQTEQEKRYQTEHSNNQYNDWVKYNILNPYGQGMDLNTSLAYTGQQFGQGNTGMGIAGAGLSALKGVRSFLSGYGSGRGQQNVERQMRDRLYNNDESLYQQGGMRIAQQGLGEEEELYGQNQSNNYADLIQQAELQGIAEGADRIYNESPNQGQGLFNGEPLANRKAYQPPMSTNGESAFVPTTVEKVDSNSARDIWTEKTGLPWSEAKRLGYTDGTAKDNTKLLQELNDPRFKVENLRTKPFTAPVAQAKAQAKQTPTKAPTYADFQEAVKGKAKSNIKQGNISDPNKRKDFTDNIADFLGGVNEYLGHPIQTFGEYAKYGELPARGFSKHSENAYDMTLGIRNPSYWMSKIDNAADFAEQGEYKKAAIEAIGALPAAQRIKWVKYLPFLKGLPQGAQATTKALGEGAKRLPQGAQKAIGSGADGWMKMADDTFKYFPKKQQGGYIEGQEYDLTDEEIHDLLSKGYKLRYE